jgi:hypothetical protein
MRKHKCLLLLIFLALAGCLPVVEKMSVIPTSLPSPVITPPKPVAISTRTVAVPTSTPIQQITQAALPDISQHCLDIKPELPEQLTPDGTLLFQSYRDVEKVEAFLYNLKTKKQVDLAGSKFKGDVSPDRSLFAFENFKARTIEVYASTGKLIKTIYMKKNWGILSGWLDNENLVIGTSEHIEGSKSDRYPRSVIVFNLKDNSTVRYDPNYPKIDEVNPGFAFRGNITTLYDSRLTRVLYPALNPENPSFQFGIVLYDLKEQKKLAWFPAINFGRNSPVWRPDGSAFIVMGMDELYKVSRDGQKTKLSNLNPGYDQASKKTRRYSSDYYSWSPDARYVAFWLVEKPDKKGVDENLWKKTLAVLDIQTGQVTDYCIKEGFEYYSSPYPEPVWSPDSSYLLFAANYQPETRENELVILDLKQHTAHRLEVKNRMPVGWLP